MSLGDLIPKAFAQGAATDLLTGQGGAKGLQSLSSLVFDHIGNWALGIVIVIIAVIVAKVAGNAAREAILRSKGEEVQENALVLVERMTRIGIVFLGLVLALAINGLNFTAVVGALSLGVGFALKEFIENFIASVIMLAQSRIRIGDLVEINGVIGRIVSIDMRTTVLQKLDGAMVTIPNQTMLASTWVSYSANPFRRVELVMGVSYDTDIGTTTSLIKAIIAKDAEIVVKPEPAILVDNFEDSAINLKIFFWVENTKPWLNIRSNLANRLKKAFDKAGIVMPYPILTLKVDEDDRALLKTMDSLKKGLVPEAQAKPSREALVQAFEDAEKESSIPYNLFETPKPVPETVAAIPSPAPQVSTSAMPPTHV